MQNDVKESEQFTPEDLRYLKVAISLALTDPLDIDEMPKTKGGTSQTVSQNRTNAGRRRIMTRLAKTEECYDIFRQIFHNEEDARAAVLHLFGGEDYEAQ